VIEDDKTIGYYDLIEEPYCKKCSSPNVTTEKCIIRNDVYGFNRIYAMGIYKSKPPWDHLLSSHIRWLKGGNLKYAKPLGKALNLTVQNRYPELLEADYVVPVPAHPDKVLRRRGFNQAEVIAEEFCYNNTLRVFECLKQVKDVELRGKGIADRYLSIFGMFDVGADNIDQIKDKNIILIDDVVTCGATMSECSNLLIKNGAKLVNGLTLGRTVLNDGQ